MPPAVVQVATTVTAGPGPARDPSSFLTAWPTLISSPLPAPSCRPIIVVSPPAVRPSRVGPGPLAIRKADAGIRLAGPGLRSGASGAPQHSGSSPGPWLPDGGPGVVLLIWPSIPIVSSFRSQLYIPMPIPMNTGQLPNGVSIGVGSSCSQCQQHNQQTRDNYLIIICNYSNYLKPLKIFAYYLPII